MEKKKETKELSGLPPIGRRKEINITAASRILKRIYPDQFNPDPVRSQKRQRFEPKGGGK